MANPPLSSLIYHRACPDCGNRVTILPAPLPEVADDFDWRARDFDGFRRFLLEDLAARFPRRYAWTAADLEVVLVEALAASLDHLSDLLDRVTAEAWLETARQPASVRGLLAFIGCDVVREAYAQGLIATDPLLEPQRADAELDALWTRQPDRMEEARRRGPATIRCQRRMVTLEDYATGLEAHPLVLRAHAWTSWTGSWDTVAVAVIAVGNRRLDSPLDPQTDAALRGKVAGFHATRSLPLPWAEDPQRAPTIRQVLLDYLNAYRMVGTEVALRDAQPVGVSLSLSVRVADHYFRSEVRAAVEAALKELFAPGRLQFGQAIVASDLFERLMALPGVAQVCLNRFKRVGAQYADQTASGRIAIDELEIAVCDNLAGVPERGYYHLTLHGGLAG